MMTDEEFEKLCDGFSYTTSLVVISQQFVIIWLYWFAVGSKIGPRQPTTRDKAMQTTELSKDETRKIIEDLLGGSVEHDHFWSGLEAKLRDLYQQNQTLYERYYPPHADGSGELRETDWKPANTIDEWLTRYTGQWDATYQPGMGKHWKTWREEVESICNRHLRELVSKETEAEPDHCEIMEWACWMVGELDNCQDEILGCQ